MSGSTIPIRERASLKHRPHKKNHTRMFAFTNEAFFPTRRWKFAKRVLGTALVAFTSYAWGVAPLEASSLATQELHEEEFVHLASGIPVNATEAALLKQKLLIKEYSGATQEEGMVHIAVAELPKQAVAPMEEPLEVIETVTETRSLGVRTLTAYNSDPAQTDDTPCITANGFNVCTHGIEDTVAANFLPFGTKIRIPELFGERIFIVRDRMNTRYPHRVDVWMLDNGDARQFGVRRAEIQLIIE